MKTGQVLAVLDISKLQDTVNRGEAALASSKARLVQAEATLKESQVKSIKRLREVSRLSDARSRRKAR